MLKIWLFCWILDIPCWLLDNELGFRFYTVYCQLSTVYWIFRAGCWILSIGLFCWILDILPPCGIPRCGTGYWIFNLSSR